nr:FAD-dependent oxidoreductase [Occultella kanbiaonis]
MRAGTIVINTGARSALPGIDGIHGTGRSMAVVTSTELLSRPARPRHLVVPGGGYVGVEFAAMHARYGVPVTLIARGPTILRQEEPDAVAAAVEILADAGVTIVTDAQVTGVRDEEPDGGAVDPEAGGGWARVTYERDGATETVRADVVLAALGREPDTEALDLPAAGVETDARRRGGYPSAHLGAARVRRR